MTQHFGAAHFGGSTSVRGVQINSVALMTYSLVYNVNVRCCIFLPNKPLFCSQTQCSVASTQIWIVNLANVCYFCRVRYLNHRWYLQHRLQWSPIGTCKNFSFKVKKQVSSKHPRYKGGKLAKYSGKTTNLLLLRLSFLYNGLDQRWKMFKSSQFL
jgi:hypothetical protein